jgi:YHS domain-containing protein
MTRPHEQVRGRRAALAAALALLVAGTAGGLAGAGCGPRPATGGARAHVASEHGHAAPHGGVVVVVGDRHHAEAVWEPDTGRVQVFVLGADEQVPFPIPVQTLAATFEDAAGAGERAFTLRAKPLPGEAAGSFASRFEGVAPRAMAGAAAPALTLALPLGGRERRVRFEPLVPAGAAASAADGEHPERDGAGAAAPPEMTARERALFLTPGGLYTRADIAANGRMAPAQRYRGVMASHNQHPPKGARVCPISGTEANPKFAWVVGGKRYLFCCPPCIEEFVQQAKARPETVRPPQDYVKKD